MEDGDDDMKIGSDEEEKQSIWYDGIDNKYNCI
jgi:hypothetical protein